MLDVRDMTFVVRCAGERTMDASIALLREQVAALGGDPRAQIRPVIERPFVNAVRATLELGIASGRPWTIGMDADVLLLSDGVRRLAGLCAAAPDDVYTITTLVFCKYFGGFCFRGIHAYPTRLLGQALPLIESSNAAESLRPETSVVNAMLARGYKMLGPPVPVGAHDFEQSFRHIYLKMRLRARRELGDEPGKTTTDYFEFVRARAAVDPEYLVAFWGLEDGRRDALAPGGSPAHYDWDGEYPEFDDRLTRASMTEKGPLGLHEARGLADRLMASHEYVADRRTPKWIRDKHGFAEGVSVAGARMGLGVPVAA